MIIIHDYLTARQLCKSSEIVILRSDSCAEHHRLVTILDDIVLLMKAILRVIRDWTTIDGYIYNTVEIIENFHK